MMVRFHGVRFVTVQLSRLFARLAVVGVLACALGLAACGRKAGLDPPPSAAIEPPPPTAQSGTASEPAPGTSQSGFTPDGRPVAAPGAKKRLPIDFLID
jgi:predicted small lipoprotein YifL